MLKQLVLKNEVYYLQITYDLINMAFIRTKNTGSSDKKTAEKFFENRKNLYETFDRFLRYKEEIGLREKTLDSYVLMISLFIEQTDISSPEEITYEKIQEYRRSLHAREISKVTINTYMRQLKVFISWCEEEKIIKEPFSQKIRQIKVAKKNIYLYSENEVKMIFNAAAATVSKEWMSFRNQALIALMYDSGLRRHELTEIRKNDFKNGKDGTLLLNVHGKGGKERIVPLGQNTKILIQKYLSTVPMDIANNESIFKNQTNTTLTDIAIDSFVEKMKSVLPFPFHCHNLRHNFATNFCIEQLERYGQIDIYKLQIILGHSDIKTTEIYVHIAKEYCTTNFVSQLDSIFDNIA